MKLKDLPFGALFYWKGKKWVAVIAPRVKPKRAYTIVCAQHPQGPWLKMPSNRQVKPVIKAKGEHNEKDNS